MRGLVCGAWVSLPCSVWNLPRAEIEPVNLALAGRFLTTGFQRHSDPSRNSIDNKQAMFPKRYCAQIKLFTSDRLSSHAFSGTSQVSAVTILHLPSPGPDTAVPGIPGFMVPLSLSDGLFWFGCSITPRI